MNARHDALASVLAGAPLGNRQQLDRVADARGFLHILRRHARDALDRDVVDAHARVKGQ